MADGALYQAEFVAGQVMLPCRSTASAIAGQRLGRIDIQVIQIMLAARWMRPTK